MFVSACRACDDGVPTFWENAEDCARAASAHFEVTGHPVLMTTDMVLATQFSMP